MEPVYVMLSITSDVVSDILIASCLQVGKDSGPKINADLHGVSRALLMRFYARENGEVSPKSTYRGQRAGNYLPLQRRAQPLTVFHPRVRELK